MQMERGFLAAMSFSLKTTKAGQPANQRLLTMSRATTDLTGSSC